MQEIIERKLALGAAYLNYGEASALLGVKTGTLYAWVSRRVIPFVRLSPRVVRFQREAIEKWIAERTVQPAIPRQ